MEKNDFKSIAHEGIVTHDKTIVHKRNHVTHEVHKRNHVTHEESVAYKEVMM